MFKKSLHSSKLWRYPAIRSSSSFIVLPFTFRSTILLEFISAYDLNQWSTFYFNFFLSFFLFQCGYLIHPAPCFLKTLYCFSLLLCIANIVKNPLSVYIESVSDLPYLILFYAILSYPVLSHSFQSVGLWVNFCQHMTFSYCFVTLEDLIHSNKIFQLCFSSLVSRSFLFLFISSHNVWEFLLCYIFVSI